MKKAVARKLNILDGMLLVAGAAIAISLLRLYFVNQYPNFASRLEDAPDKLFYIRWIMAEAGYSSCLWLTALTPIVFFIRLRPPRPAISKLVTQPGTTACFAVAVMVAIGAILTTIAVSIEGRGSWFYFYQTTLFRLFPYAGASVLAVWAIQGLGGRWRPEAGAIDRLGRILGFWWIATFLVGTEASLQEGAMFAKDQVHMSQLVESMHEENRGYKVDLDTLRKNSLVGSLERSRIKRIKLKQLIDSGDAEQWKAELIKTHQSLEESEQEDRAEIEKIEHPPKVVELAAPDPPMPPSPVDQD